MPGHQVFAAMVLRQFYLAADRVPVHVHIGWAHEDGLLQAFILEVFWLISLFYHHHLTIAGRDYQGFALLHVPARYAEKGNNEKEQYQGYHEKAPDKHRRLSEEIKNGHIKQRQHQKSQYNSAQSFAMDLHVCCWFVGFSNAKVV